MLSLVMHRFWQRVEKINRRLIPLALILLLVIILFELFSHSESEALHRVVLVTDSLVVTIFVIDLIFLGIKAKSVKFFFKNYWLDVLAVFPFGLAFKTLETTYEGLRATERLVLGERFVVGQEIVHEALEVGKEARLVKEAELLKEGELIKEVKLAGKSERLFRVLRSLGRGIRFFSKSKVFAPLHKPKKRK